MAPVLTLPENQKLFHKVRKGSMFPQIMLTINTSSGLLSGWARCAGFNLNQGRFFCLPLHSHFALETQEEPGTLVMACPEAGLSLHFLGTFCSLRDPKLTPHFWDRLKPQVETLNLQPEQLLDFEVASMTCDRFCQV